MFSNLNEIKWDFLIGTHPTGMHSCFVEKTCIFLVERTKKKGVEFKTSLQTDNFIVDLDI